MAQHIDTRERRHIIGDYHLTPVDIACGKKYYDAIGYSRSNWDSHGYSNHLLFRFWFPHLKKAYGTYIPYRMMLPKGVENVLVAGIGFSAHRDSSPVIRMQPDIQNNGYAAGLAAAIALRDKVSVRNINIQSLQRKLVKKGILDLKGV